MEHLANIPIFGIPGTLFGKLPGISQRTFSEYTRNILWKCSTDIPRIYVCLVGINTTLLLRKRVYSAELTNTKLTPSFTLA